jgi:hypothetical protein
MKAIGENDGDKSSERPACRLFESYVIAQTSTRKFEEKSNDSGVTLESLLRTRSQLHPSHPLQSGARPCNGTSERALFSCS